MQYIKGIRCRICLIAPKAEAIFLKILCTWHSQFKFWSICTPRDFADFTLATVDARLY